jgi:transposase
MASSLPHSPWPPDDVVAVRDKLEELARAGRFDDAIRMIVELLVRVRDDNTALQVRLHNALRQLNGRRSEKIDSSQLLLLFEQLGQEVPESAEKIIEELKQDAEAARGSNDGADQRTRTPAAQPRAARLALAQWSLSVPTAPAS